MMRALGLVLVLGACGIGNDPGPGGDDGGGGDDVEERILCTADLEMSGTFTAAAALDPEMGCQPAGTWTVTVTVADKGNCATVPVKQQYVYTVNGVGAGSTITYSGSGDETNLQISANGNGGCKGSFEHIAASEGKFLQFEMSPTLPEPTAAVTTLEIGGSGTFNLWSVHP